MADLRKSLVLRQATDDDLKGILEASSVRQAEEGSYFFLQGDPSTHAYVLVLGQVKLLQSNRTGQVVNLRTVYPWQLFGALGAVRGTAEYPASAQALEDSAALGNSQRLPERVAAAASRAFDGPDATDDILHPGDAVARTASWRPSA